MTKLLSFDIDTLKDKKAYWTAKEIEQQPVSWQKAALEVVNNNESIQDFLKPLLAQAELNIVFTGAGTSAYVGETVVPHIVKHTGLQCQAISTTEIVSNPTHYLNPEKPTLLVSFGRSGNSPESVAAVKLANQVIKDCYHLVITCNAEGQLAQQHKQCVKSKVLLMPEETLDQSFAMTSSFTSMLVTALAIFTPDQQQLASVVEATQSLLSEQADIIKQKVNINNERLVFLGSGPLLGIAREAALKCLELTSGRTLSYFESPLGFRHGPKSLVNGKTDIVVLSSAAQYTRQYDTDLYNELLNDQIAATVTRLTPEQFGITAEIDEAWLGLIYIVYCQIMSFHLSVNMGISPDNPCPTGEVNRVVQGVTIYPL